MKKTCQKTSQTAQYRFRIGTRIGSTINRQTNWLNIDWKMIDWDLKENVSLKKRIANCLNLQKKKVMAAPTKSDNKLLVTMVSDFLFRVWPSFQLSFIFEFPVKNHNNFPLQKKKWTVSLLGPMKDQQWAFQWTQRYIEAIFFFQLTICCDHRHKPWAVVFSAILSRA